MTTKQQTPNAERLDFLRKYCTLLESQFTVPIINYKFGIDPLLSFIPWLGSYSGLLLGFIFIVLAHRQGVSGRVKVLMFRNIILDFFLGIIPVVGNISDFIYKSNEKNLKLLEEHLSEDKHSGSGWGLILIFLLIILVIFFISIWVVLAAVKYFVSLLN